MDGRESARHQREPLQQQGSREHRPSQAHGEIRPRRAPFHPPRHRRRHRGGSRRPRKTIPSWAAPANQAEKDKNHAPLLIGQLKAIADPFYTRLHAAAPHWLEAARVANGTNHPNSIFPWTSETTDDNNKGIANIGQLKAVFSLHFTHDSDSDGLTDLGEVADSNGDGIADIIAAMLGLSLYLNDTDGDGVSNAVEMAAGSDPLVTDSDGDGVPDNLDAYPLDPERTSFAPGDAGDTTAPLITLLEPTGAVPIP